MKVIDLLVKISKGEEVPKEIKIENDELYFSKYKNTYVFEDGGNLNWCYYVTNKSLTDEIEIIEEEKEIEFEDIKELGNNFTFENTNSELEVRDFEKSIISKKINSLIKNQKKIIDVINDMRDKKC